MFNDTISDVLTRIRNAVMVRNTTVRVPLTKISQQLCQILEKEGFIASFQRETANNEERPFLIINLKYSGTERKPCITNLRRVSSPGLRIYTNSQNIPKVLGGMGIMILSTSKGLMTDREARFRRIGGEILCSIW
jgi:small subunit ribosomal protein S8